MKTAIVSQIGKKPTLQVAEYVATISPGETVTYINYLTALVRMCGDNLTRLLVEHSSRRLQRGRVQEPAGRLHLPHHQSYRYHARHCQYLDHHNCCQGGITEYTITISAIVGNAKMKGVTTKVWWMRVIFIKIFMLTFYLKICQQLPLGVSTPLSTTKSNTSPFGLDAKQQVSP